MSEYKSTGFCFTCSKLHDAWVLIKYDNKDLNEEYCVDCYEKVRLEKKKGKIATCFINEKLRNLKYGCNECCKTLSVEDIVLPSNNEWICRCLICDYVVREFSNLPKEVRVKISEAVRFLNSNEKSCRD